MQREWENEEEMERDSLSTFSHFLPLYLFSILRIVSFCHKMLNAALLSRISQIKLTYSLWENNSGSNSLQESSASCKGLPFRVKSAFPYKELVTMSFFQSLLRYLVRRRSLCEIRCHNFPLLTLVLHQAESIFVEKSYLGIYRIFTQTHQKFMSMNKGWF